MNVQYTQDDRLGVLTTDLGKDVLLLLTFSGADHVNDLFDYKVRVLTRKHVEYDALLGTHATIALNTVNHGDTHFDGIVTRIDWLQMTEAGEEYELTLRPWFWLAGKRRQQRIFHEMSVDQILGEVLGAYGGFGQDTHRMSLTGSYPTLEYTVQYRESDLTFACRLMERFGISYHFTHEAGNHCLVLTDGMESMSKLPGVTREYRPTQAHYRKEEEHFWEWRKSRGMTTGKIKLTDYNFKTPAANLLREQTGDAAFTHGEIESYDYPGVYPDGAQGNDVAHLRTIQERSTDQRHVAKGDVMGLKAGMRCAASGPFAQWLEGEQHLCLEARHHFTSESYRAGQGSDSDDAYVGRYVLTPVSAPFAPVRKTPMPIVHGPQTARVVGEGEIDCDEYGRILVRFHWDLDDSYSMRCRVSQNWASKGWGGMVIPRIGMEVVVEFLEGDPDKPLVTGCVYNGKNDVPYPLPANKTRSTFKTDSHQASYDGFNELRFEDERYSEEVYLKAQKDLSIKVQNDQTRIVDENSVEYVGRNHVSMLGHDRYSEVNGSIVEYVGPTKYPSMGVKAARRTTDQLTRFAQNVISLAANAGRWSMTLFVKGNRSTMIGGDETKQIGGRYGKQIDGIYNINVKSNFDLHSKRTVRLEAAKHIELTAASSISLGCGKGRLVILKDGSIRLYGTEIDIVGEKSVDVDGGRTVRIDTPASSIDVTDSKVAVKSARIDLN